MRWRWQRRSLAVVCLFAAGIGCVRSEIGGPGRGPDPDSGGAAGDTGGALPDSAACGELNVDACTSNSTCAVLSGRRITGDPACTLPAETVGCGTNQGCAMATVRATDPKSVDWLFPTTCIPAGWIDNSSKGTRFDTCPPAAGGSPDADAGGP